MLMLGFCGMNIGYMIQNQRRVDTTLLFAHEAILQGYQIQCQKMFSSFFMSDRFELSNELNMDKMFFLHLQLNYDNKNLSGSMRGFIQPPDEFSIRDL